MYHSICFSFCFKQFVLNLIISTSIMGNPNSNPTRYKIEQMHWRGALNKCTGGVHWTDALDGCIEQVYWVDALTYKYTPVYSISLIRKRKRKWKQICHYYQREKEKKNTLLSLKEFRLWKTQDFRLRLVISCRTSDSTVLVWTASARKLTKQLVNFIR
jgi:hypothetical protein